jgi:hypothetical protein
VMVGLWLFNSLEIVLKAKCEAFSAIGL